ncbi:hypothetical protein BSL78_07913 [Apostichopus japonicus]|uniref:Transmembrane protein n=1 Tax=Stichopus japonicus TaxID=307972 RepID=A0A2G8L4I8_STIJA|nr:hypothetical protein BSL78_07913 [Apostichopus japonicus]
MEVFKAQYVIIGNYGNILALSQVTGYVLSTILFFFIIWPMSNNLRSFNGNCILFSSGQYDIKDQKFEVTDWAYGSSCAFVIFLSLLIVFISIWQTIRISIHLVKNTDSSFLGVFFTCISNLIIFLMLLGTAPSVTAGFKIWCDSLEVKRSITCANAALVIHWKDTSLQPEGFYLQIAVVEFGLYVTLLTWFIENIFSAYKLLNYHRQEHVFRSLSRERQRLLGDYEPEF